MGGSGGICASSEPHLDALRWVNWWNLGGILVCFSACGGVAGVNPRLSGFLPGLCVSIIAAAQISSHFGASLNCGL